MWNDFDDDDNQWDDGDEEDFRKEQDRINKHPLMQKANDIMLLTETLVGVLDEGAKEMYGTFMLEDATVICGKFGGAEGVDDYILKMENAVFMKVHARHLNSMTYSVAMVDNHAEEHLQLLRDAINDFKALFVDWVKGFDPSCKYDDGWGLF
ncbi:hypothetical protein [Echinicola vietnamensis]|uniref:Uncharacterized protein n=1 Tax=Echinicola vietnamensis (strain DSM 17526 / LMG 23754 / KMM 6221) TaxID=926556 RepID=L0FVW1_ECHVK|nr:hypothetical protein [Echinicola vietnamensis]AGA77168.1 hypothetical protein Echvi_0895 [Echinicola vietnamensis DSM 17526]